jgi:hypothetical protein
MLIGFSGYLMQKKGSRLVESLRYVQKCPCCCKSIRRVGRRLTLSN